MDAMEEFTKASLTNLNPDSLLEIFKRMEPEDVASLCSLPEFTNFCSDKTFHRALMRHFYPEVRIDEEHTIQQFKYLAFKKLYVLTYLIEDMNSLGPLNYEYLGITRVDNYEFEMLPAIYDEGLTHQVVYYQRQPIIQQWEDLGDEFFEFVTPLSGRSGQKKYIYINHLTGMAEDVYASIEVFDTREDAILHITKEVYRLGEQLPTEIQLKSVRKEFETTNLWGRIDGTGYVRYNRILQEVIIP